MNTTINNFAHNLKTFRKQNGLSQEQIAEKLFVTRQAISKWERGEAIPDIENLASIANLFGVSVDELIEGENILDQNDLHPRESLTLAERKLKYHHIRLRADIIKIIAIMIYIITPFIFAVVDRDEMLILFGLLIAVATGLIILSNTIYQKYYDLVGFPPKDQKPKKRTLANKISAVVSSLATIAFFYLGFFHDLWHPGWIVFLLPPLSRQIVILFENQEE